MDSQPAERVEGQVRPTTKALALEAIAALPDDSNFEDVIGHLQLMRAAQRGPDDPDAGPIAPEDEVRRQMARWLS